MNNSIIKSFQYALTGIQITWTEEVNFRIEILCTILVLALGIFFQFSWIEYIVVILTSCLVLTIEVINTALEELCDKFQPSRDPHIAKIKDLAAAAVLCASIGAMIVGLLVFIPHLRQPLLSFDTIVENTLYSIRSQPYVQLFSSITLLGDGFVIAVMGGVIALALLIFRKKAYFEGFVVTLLGTAVSVWLVKILTHRVRPQELISLGLKESSFSFPSGHAAAAMAFYGFMIYLLWKISSNTLWRTKVFCLGSLIILAVGFSRLYLGVHFFSDVIVGYAFGGVWLCIGIILSKQPKDTN